MVKKSPRKRTLKEVRTQELGHLYAAREEYLRNAGWRPMVTGPGQVLWLDPQYPNAILRDDRAAEIQERRDNDIVHRD